MRSKMCICSTLLLLSLCQIAVAQSTIEGVVRDYSGLVLQSVSISNRSTGLTTTTNPQGTFSMQGVYQGDTLIFRHVAYRDTAVVFDGKMTILSIVLNDVDHAIDEVEVISTGYQQVPRERASGSFSVIENGRISEQIGFSIMDRIPAVASGVLLDRNSRAGSDQLLVRGMSTILGETAPLIVLDNFPYEGDLSGINPDDIENITILRDASAASIWGAKAGNGVIVITSKKGKYNQRLKVDFSSLTSVETKPDLFSVDRINSSDMLDVEDMLFEQGYYNSMINSAGKPVLSPAVELFIQRAATSDPNTIAEIDRELDRLRTLDVRNDFLKYMYRSGFRQQSTLGLSQGSDRLVWNASVSNANLIGNLDERNGRNTFVTNSRLNIGSRLVLDAGINISFLRSRSGRPGYDNISAYNGGLFPYAEFADADQNPLPLYKDWRITFLEQEAHPGLLDWKYYPLEDYKHSFTEHQSQNTILSTGLDYSLPKWIKLSLKYQFQKQAGGFENLRTVDSYEARNMINSYAQENNTTGGIEFHVPKGGILDRSNSSSLAHNIRGQLNFDWDNSIHRTHALLGVEGRSVSTGSNYDRLYGYNPDNLSFSLLDVTIPYRSYITGGTSFLPNVMSLNQRTDRFVSVFFNGSYTLRDKYTVTSSLRRDASNLFGLHVNDKWNPFWSAGIAWTISKESFWRNNPIGHLRLRATYGRTGNVNPAMVALTTIQYVGANAYTQTPYARFDTYANPELRWETVGMANIGLDFRSRSQRISGTIEGYWKKGTDLYGNSPMDYTSGVDANIVKNVASISGRGVDLTLNTVNTKGHVEWLSNLNISMNHDKVTKYHMLSNMASQFVGSTNRISGKEGAPIYAMYSYKWMGLDAEDGAPLGLLDGEASREYRQLTGTNTTVDDLVYHGRIQPPLFGSLGNTVSWKEWSMTFRMSYKFNYFFRRQTIRYSLLFSRWDGHGDFNKRWKQSGDEAHTDVPAMLYPVPSGMENFYLYAEPFVERGDHVRLEYVNLSYRLPIQHMRTLRDATLIFNLNNVGLLYRRNKIGLDPDRSSASNTGFSLPRIYSLTLKCTL